MEQTRFSKDYNKEVSFDLFVPLSIEPNDIGVLKLLNLNFKENEIDSPPSSE